MTKKVTNNARTREIKPRIVKTEKLLQEIFERVANGESLNKICSEPNMPSRKSFYEWVGEDETVLRRYEFAMIMRADTYAEETIEIADDDSDDWKTGRDGSLIPDYEVVQRSKLRVDARKWRTPDHVPLRRQNPDRTPKA
jgi:hypothetical protein